VTTTITSSQCFSFNVRDEVSYQHKIISKTIVSYILVSMFSSTTHKDQRSYTERQMEFPEFNLFLNSCMQFSFVSAIHKHCICPLLLSQEYYQFLRCSFVLHSGHNKLMHTQVFFAHPSRSTYLVETTTAFPYRIYIFVLRTNFTGNGNVLTCFTQF
jgi:hypothetical protein